MEKLQEKENVQGSLLNNFLQDFLGKSESFENLLHNLKGINKKFRDRESETIEKVASDGRDPADMDYSLKMEFLSQNFDVILKEMYDEMNKLKENT